MSLDGLKNKAMFEAAAAGGEYLGILGVPNRVVGIIVKIANWGLNSRSIISRTH